MQSLKDIRQNQFIVVLSSSDVECQIAYCFEHHNVVIKENNLS